MKTATGLALIAFGAILALAVTAQPSFINLHVAGFVIMLTGVAGIFIPKRGYGWLLRRVTVRRGPRGQVYRTEDRRIPPYLVLNPAAEGPRPGGPEPGDLTSPLRADGTTGPATLTGEQVIETPAGTTRPTEETVEEFIEE